MGYKIEFRTTSESLLLPLGLLLYFDSFRIALKQIVLTILLTLHCLPSIGQDSISQKTSENSMKLLAYYLHYSGGHGPWRIAEKEIRRPDSTTQFTLAYGERSEDSSRFYTDKKRFYQNEMVKQHLYIDFSKRKKAVILEKHYDRSGKIIYNKKLKARRRLGQTRIPRTEWRVLEKHIYLKGSGSLYSSA